MFHWFQCMVVGAWLSMCGLLFWLIFGNCGVFVGGCHLIRRDIKKSIRNKMDYDRCHACSDRIKHPKGDQFIGGHNSTRMPYYSAFPCVNKK